MVDMHAAMAVGRQSDGAPEEPVLEVDEIQGNIVPGFMKPKMGVLALAVGDVSEARRWIGALVPHITTLAGVMPSRMRVRAERLARRVVAGHTDVVDELDDRWLNIAFSYQGLATLLGSDSVHSGDTAKFGDDAFRKGAAVRSSLLGDPTDPEAEGHPGNWVFGGPGKEADVLLVFGTDRDTTMTAFIEEVRTDALAAGLTVLYEEQGGKLDALGREQFGFQDGVSQPGVRGRLATDPDTFVTPRTIAPESVPESWLYGSPGQYLVWPGEFVMGYPKQGADPMLAGPPELPGPPWCRNGSYAVYRRLRQDVAGFRTFVTEQAASLAAQAGFEAMTAERLAATLIGRWHSGAPLARVPDGDDPNLGADPLANNNFGFAADTPTLDLIGGGSTNGFPEAKADPVGVACPLAAHIRKVNTRDVGSDQGGRRSSFNRRLLRRGLPYGPRLPEAGPDPVDGNRGLMFLSYQASIVDQFEFLCQAWMADPIAPRSPSGHDMVIGQNGQPGQGRVRSCTLLTTTGQSGTVTSTADVVIPTAAGYFFSPSISALRDVLATTAN
jgi:Dyp-type peroxidase family